MEEPSKRKWNNAHWLQYALKRAGINEDSRKITTHGCRHTFASRMVKAGMSLLEVQTLLGHKKIESTMAWWFHLTT